MAGATTGSSMLRRNEHVMSGVTSGSHILRNQERRLSRRKAKPAAKSVKRPDPKN